MALPELIIANAQRYIIAFAVFIFFCVCAYATRFAFALIHHWASKTKTNLDDFILKALRMPVRLLLIVLGLFFAAFILNPDFKIHDQISVSKVFVVLFVVLGAFAVSRLIKAVIQWYVVDMSHRYKTGIDDTIFRFGRRLISIFIYVMAFLIILDHFGIAIGPLMTGLGIAGLAVALALQDTLSNFFASLHITVDRICRVGDYIELDANIQGYVEDIGWRTTRIRTRQDNIIVIPNSKITQAILINYSLPQTELSLKVHIDVAYDSDLDRAEKVTLDVARHIQKTVRGAVKHFEPTLRYKVFKDSGIGLTVTLRVEKFDDKYYVQHEFMKQLVKRYREEKIEIPFPQRVVHMRTS